MFFQESDNVSCFRSCLISIGDILHKINYQPVAGLSAEQAASLLNGPPKSSVVLGIVKPKHKLRVNVRLQREHVRGTTNQDGLEFIRRHAQPEAAKRGSDQTAQQLGMGRRAVPKGVDIPRSTLQFSTPIRASYNYSRPTPPLTPFMISPYHSIPRMEYRL